MRTSLTVALFFAAFALTPTLRAQDEPKLELYGGYDYARFNINANVTGQPPSQTFNGNGGGGQLIYNFNDWLGVLGDVSGVWATNATRAGAAIPYLFGPRINFWHRKMTPFAQVLVGGVATSSGIETGGWQTHFAMATGGGIDIRLSKHFSLRPFQAEFLMTRLPNGINNRQDNFQVSAGVSLTFGGK
jgi:hypothetical protein